MAYSHAQHGDTPKTSISSPGSPLYGDRRGVGPEGTGYGSGPGLKFPGGPQFMSAGAPMSTGYYDLESGSGGGYAAPVSIYDDPLLRWGFIRKVYGILSAQVVLTLLFSSFVIYNESVKKFALASPGLVLLVAIIPFLTLCALGAFHQSHPLNLFLLAIFTLSIAFTLGLSTAFVPGDIVLEALLLTAVIVVSLTLFTFWAASQGIDFGFLGPMLFVSLILLVLVSLIQLFFPFGSFGRAVVAAGGALLFCFYIIYDTDNLMKRYSYDEYIWASVALYLDVVNLFINLLYLLQRQE